MYSLHRAGTANLPGAVSHISGLDTREGLLHTILLRYSSWSFTRQHSNTDQDQTSFTTRVSRASCGPQHLANPTDPLAWSGRPEIGPWQVRSNTPAGFFQNLILERETRQSLPTGEMNTFCWLNQINFNIMWMSRGLILGLLFSYWF